MKAIISGGLRCVFDWNAVVRSINALSIKALSINALSINALLVLYLKIFVINALFN